MALFATRLEGDTDAMKIFIVVVVIVVVVLLLLMAAAARIVKQYEEGVLFRLGRVLGTRKPSSFT